MIRKQLNDLLAYPSMTVFLNYGDGVDEGLIVWFICVKTYIDFTNRTVLSTDLPNILSILIRAVEIDGWFRHKNLPCAIDMNV